MGVAVLLLLVKMSSGLYKTESITAPTLAVCREHQPLIEEAETRKPGVASVQGVCLVFPA